MDAMYTLWSVNDDDGQKLYGNDYHSIDYFIEAHHFNAGWQDADHIHEGLGTTITTIIIIITITIIIRVPTSTFKNV
jgi:hypothetical protein